MGVRYTNATMSSAQRTSKYIVKGGEIDIDGELDPPPPSLFPLDGWQGAGQSIEEVRGAYALRRAQYATRCACRSGIPRRELLRTAHGSGRTKGQCCGHSLLNGAARSAVRCLTLDVCPNG
jgi:hypothetical protein